MGERQEEEKRGASQVVDPSDFFFKINGYVHWLLAHPLASSFGNLSWLEGALVGHVG